MNVKWPAVLFGSLVDFAISLLLQAIVISVGLSSFYESPSLGNPLHLLLMLLFVASTGVGGFVAARLCEQSLVLNGLLVGVTSILLSALLSVGAPTPPLVFALVQVVSCGAGALGGWAALRLRGKAA